MIASFLTSFLLGVATAVALPSPAPDVGTTPLTLAEIESYKPYAMLSRAAYCPASKTANWTCGEACNALPGMMVYGTGGDGVATPYWFVGYYPQLESIVLSNQGTDPSKVLPILVDINMRLDSLDSTLFPGVSPSVKTHDGFQEAQERSAKAKLAAIQKAMSEHDTSSVTLTGHSLGGAITLIDALYLSINLPSVKLKVVTHGMPRVGNQAFVDLVVSKITDIARINNQRDMVPILPGKRLGYRHVTGEKHIISPRNWVACAGQENTDRKCTGRTVSSIVMGRTGDHLGPYDGILIGTAACK